MTEFSDPGYDYLGKLLASRGFILISVDANFLNFNIPVPEISEMDRDGIINHIESQSGAFYHGN